MLLRTCLLPELLALTLAACSSTRHAPGPKVPEFLLGEFEDDYGIRYKILSDRWRQLPRASFNVVEWHIKDQFVVTQNDKSNPSDAGMYTRIDWVGLDDTEYEWAFCYAVYDAETMEDAVAAPASRRDTPRTGCGTYPFSRMKRVHD